MELDPTKVALYKDVVSIVQGVTITLATLFTARWTYRTFAHKEKVQELRELKKLIEEYHQAIQVFCMVVRETASPDDRELGERVHLAQLHNRMVAMASLNLYTKKKLRERMRMLVGSWLVDGRLEKMQRRPDWKATEDARVKEWNRFEAEYKEALAAVDDEADRLL
jgi:hypothetical protein